MAEVLAPRFELFGGLANILTELDKGISKTVRVEIRQASTDEGIAEYRAYGRSSAPVGALQPVHLKLARHPQRNARCREKRIVIALEFICPEIGHPLRHNPANILTHRKKEGVKGLAEFRLNFARILIDAVRD